MSALVAATAATSSPAKRMVRASVTFAAPSSFSIAFPASSVSPSAAKKSALSKVTTVRTPGNRAAFDASMPSSRACGCGLRSTRPCSIPGRLTS